MNWKKTMGSKYLANWLKTELENQLYESGYDAETDKAMVKVLALIDKDMVEQALDAYEEQAEYWTREAQLVASSNHG